MANEGKKELEELTHITVEKGGLLVKLYFDMESEREEELQPLMVDLINNRLLKSPGVVYCSGAIDQPLKVKDTFSTSAEVTALFDSLWPLVNVMFNFSPAAVEVLRPSKDYLLKQTELQALLLNVAQISMEYNNYVLSRVLKPEDMEKIKEQTARREELGRKLMEKKDGAQQ